MASTNRVPRIPVKRHAPAFFLFKISPRARETLSAAFLQKAPAGRRPPLRRQAWMSRLRSNRAKPAPLQRLTQTTARPVNRQVNAPCVCTAAIRGAIRPAIHGMYVIFIALTDLSGAEAKPASIPLSAALTLAANRTVNTALHRNLPSLTIKPVIDQHLTTQR